jgi:hypothetical protein
MLLGEDVDEVVPEDEIDVDIGISTAACEY